MTVTGTDIHEIKNKLAPLLGKKAWGVSKGVGSFVTLEFGRPLPTNGSNERTHGEWHLWLYNCAWRLEAGRRQVLAGSGDSPDRIEAAIQQLEGLSFDSIEISPPALDTAMTFSEDMTLRLFPISQDMELEHWMLYTPDGNVLLIGPGTSWSYENAEEVEA